MFTTPAFAQGSLFGGAGGDGGMLMSLLPFVLIFVIMYFLILRPQQKRVKTHNEMVKNVRRGDTVVTNGGLIGKVTKVIDDDQIEIEIADGRKIQVAVGARNPPRTAIYVSTSLSPRVMLAGLNIEYYGDLIFDAAFKKDAAARVYSLHLTI